VIYVKRDPSRIPERLLKVAARAQERLEQLPADQRQSFIRKKAHVWRAFARYLAKMSYGKCWYSESVDPQSFFDVDHYRPKSEAKRSKDVVDAGYEWLAFSWENFRYSAQRSNRRSTDEETDDTTGKGSWFPLADESPRARWDDRCEHSERPILLDPVNAADVRLIDVRDDGRMAPSQTCIGTARIRVERSIELYGLNLPRLTAARLKVMRDVIELHTVLMQTIEAAGACVNVADSLPIQKQIDVIKKRAFPSSPYSKAARAQLFRLGIGELYPQPEEATETE